jgi:hypothetical protein
MKKRNQTYEAVLERLKVEPWFLQEVYWKNMPVESRCELYMTAVSRDLGVFEYVKPEKLTSEEYEKVVRSGIECLKRMGADCDGTMFVWTVDKEYIDDEKLILELLDISYFEKSIPEKHLTLNLCKKLADKDRLDEILDLPLPENILYDLSLYIIETKNNETIEEWWLSSNFNSMNEHEKEKIEEKIEDVIKAWEEKYKNNSY